MTTDVLSPRELGPLLELYGFSYASYLALYLSNYELHRNHITGVDVDILSNSLENDDTVEQFDINVVLCIGTASGGEIMVIGSQRFHSELLVVVPSQIDDVSVMGAAVFGTESFIHHFQDFLGLEISRTSQRPIQ